MNINLSIEKSISLVVVSWTLLVLVLFGTLNLYFAKIINETDQAGLQSISNLIANEINNDFDKLEVFLDINKDLLYSNESNLINSKLQKFIGQNELKYLKNIKVVTTRESLSSDDFSLLIKYRLIAPDRIVFIYIDKLQLEQALNNMILTSNNLTILNNKTNENYTIDDSTLTKPLVFKWPISNIYLLALNHSNLSIQFKHYAGLVSLLVYFVGLILIFAYKYLIQKFMFSSYESKLSKLKLRNQELDLVSLNLERSSTSQAIVDKFNNYFINIFQKLNLLSSLLKSYKDGNIITLLNDTQKSDIQNELEKALFLLAKKIIYKKEETRIILGLLNSEVQDYFCELSIEKGIKIKSSLEGEVQVYIAELALLQIIISIIKFQLNCLVKGRVISIKNTDIDDYICITLLDNGFGLNLSELQKYEKKQSHQKKQYELNWEELNLSIKEHGLALVYNNMDVDGGEFTLKIPKYGFKVNKADTKNNVHFLKI
jgi:hypothetical protein